MKSSGWHPSIRGNALLDFRKDDGISQEEQLQDELSSKSTCLPDVPNHVHNVGLGLSDFECGPSVGLDSMVGRTSCQ